MFNLSDFNFESHEIRFVGTADNPWRVVVDICKVLGIANNRDALTKLDEDEKGMYTTHTPGGERKVLTVTEPGLYRLIFKSRKPVAKRLKKWLTSEVIPSIRKTGGYLDGLNIAGY